MISRAEAGSCFGEVALIQEANHRTASVVADSACVLLLVKKELYEATLKVQQPGLGASLARWKGWWWGLSHGFTQLIQFRVQVIVIAANLICDPGSTFSLERSSRECASQHATNWALLDSSTVQTFGDSICGLVN
jgi:hypothetical protein